MSLERTESTDILLPFPDDKNVRVLVSGLALCRFKTNTSNIRFLRHVEHHDLIMEVTRIRKSDWSDIRTLAKISIGKKQNVGISGFTSVKPSSVVFDPNLSFLISMKRLHGPHSKIHDKNNLPSDRPSLLSIKHCAFYTHERAKKLFVFTDCNGQEIGNREHFCQYLGGYMNYGGNLIIVVEDLPGSPLTYPLEDFCYEVKFTNHCVDSDDCKNLNDFRFNYDILEDENSPDTKYCLEGFKSIDEGPVIKTPNTAACLPVCEDC